MTGRPVLVCLIDGLRPDAIHRAQTPVVRRLIQQGRFTLKAKTVLPSLSLPCISSLFYGVPPATHGTSTNWFVQGWDEPSLIDLFHMEECSTASFYNWEQLRDLSHPGSLNVSLCLNYAESYDLPIGEGDRLLVQAALALVRQPPDFCFVYLGCLDTAGHRHGWMSAEYLSALENADRCLGMLVDIFPPDGLLAVLSDHGGLNYGHGGDSAEELTIPIIFRSEAIRPGEIPSQASILDVAPTIAAFAGLPIPKAWIGEKLF